MHIQKKSRRMGGRIFKDSRAILPGKDITLRKYAEGFFDFDGRWALSKRVEGRQISERQCREKNRYFTTYALPVLGDYRLAEIKKATLKDFRNGLFKTGLAGNSINKILSTVKSILEDAEEQEIIYGGSENIAGQC
jgi:hypothetical protein